MQAIEKYGLFVVFNERNQRVMSYLNSSDFDSFVLRQLNSNSVFISDSLFTFLINQFWSH
jgi:hypothetical protein